MVSKARETISRPLFIIVLLLSDSLILLLVSRGARDMFLNVTMIKDDERGFVERRRSSERMPRAVSRVGLAMCGWW